MVPSLRHQVVLVGLLVGACASPDAQHRATSQRDSAQSGGNPLADAQKERQELSAVVVERLPAGPYTYHALREPDGRQHWLVTLGVGEQVGTQVAARVYARRDNYRSKRLGRRFDALLFGALSQ